MPNKSKTRLRNARPRVNHGFFDLWSRVYTADKDSETNKRFWGARYHCVNAVDDDGIVICTLWSVCVINTVMSWPTSTLFLPTGVQKCSGKGAGSPFQPFQKLGCPRDQQSSEVPWNLTGYTTTSPSCAVAWQ
jgi:hypothetical protein